MREECPPRATIPEMLDALESELEELRSLAALGVPRGYAVVDPAALRQELERAGLSPAEFARLADVPAEDVSAWLERRIPTPAWVLSTAQIAGQLAPSARRKLLRQPMAQTTAAVRPSNHPFSRIEEL